MENIKPNVILPTFLPEKLRLPHSPHNPYPHHITRNVYSTLPHPQQLTLPETSGFTLWCIPQEGQSIWNAV